MALDIGILVLMVGGLTAVVLFYLSEKRSLKQETIRLEKMRNGEFYQDLYEIVCRCRRRYVEQVRIRRECIEFLMLVPSGRRIVFSLSGRGYRPLSLKRQHTLSLLLAQDIPVLMDKSRYMMRKEKQPLPNGEKAVEYVFTMKIGYKDALNRAPYYMQS